MLNNLNILHILRHRGNISASVIVLNITELCCRKFAQCCNITLYYPLWRTYQALQNIPWTKRGLVLCVCVCFIFHRLSICKMIKAKVHCIMRVFEYGSLFTFISEISVCCFSCSQHNSWTDLKV